jgi:hypothetical protein
MSETTPGRTYVVGITGDISPEARVQLDASGMRWTGSYDVLREGWSPGTDTTPWMLRHVVQVMAGDADAAVQQVADALGRSDLRAGMEATEARSRR